MSNGLLAAVAVENTVFHFDRPYDYLVPPELSDDCVPGVRVLVSFGNCKRQGVVLEVRQGSASEGIKLKSIISVLDDSPIYTKEMILLAQWLKDQTFCTLFDAFRAMIPTGIYYSLSQTYVLSSDCNTDLMTEPERQIAEYLSVHTEGRTADDIFDALSLPRRVSVISSMLRKGLISEIDSVKRAIGDAHIRTVTLSENFDPECKLTPKQREITDLLTEIGGASVKEICYFTGIGESVIRTLEKRGILKSVFEEVYRDPYDELTPAGPDKKHVLSDEQAAAYNGLVSDYETGEGRVSLLYGVTGSGKTGIYMKLIDRAVEDGKNVIVMVPEISLTPQTLALFRARYGKKTAVFHSGLSMGQRLDEFKRVKRGEASIAIGTRSAVFAPFDSVGLIIIDEEQEHTYKSESSPRYDARDVARFRAKYHNSLLVLVSATPSIESLAAAKNGKIGLYTVKNRYGNAVLPEVTVVNMADEVACGNSSTFSSQLIDMLGENLVNGKQSILLLNRRGYNTFVSCRKCGHVVTCPSCSISMTYHTANRRLMCHYCGYSEQFKAKCPQCGEDNIRYAGTGTQKAEEELKNLLPDANILRVDADTTMTKFAHERLLSDFSAGKYDILIGTQMVAKGLDFPNVTLVGVLNADSVMRAGDFRGSEKGFDLLTQVIGRSGRGDVKGKAVIQTMTPDDPIIKMAQEQNVEAFYENEIAVRRLMTYPPYCDICMIGVTGVDESAVENAAQRFSLMLRERLSGDYADQKCIVLGPSPAFIKKVSGRYRYRLMIKCRSSARFRKMISELLVSFGADPTLKGITTFADINPENII
ncbi:MAG: primosomal protein N' [Clostridia bacterium]|nr:primosomal protein N' [Clostridia bacterium]